MRPYVSDDQHVRDEQLRDGTTGSDWAQFVDWHCRSSVRDPRAVIPPEAPGTDVAANVEVAGDISTACAVGSYPSSEHAAATLIVVRAPDGTYRVGRRVF
ncbi:hypothetical protein [Amycolatopsis sp. GM8]|uniref:hypothetical protein n=1 Tax=Amycolatopsis sp. GM8 TaxID=2896530 RepID=UPI001F16C7C2|nr:hypothetical protein [Amycolatopsis sp. GM8]